MRTIIAVLLICLLSGRLLASPAEPMGDGLMAAAVREATRLSHGQAGAQTSGNQTTQSGGHPVLIGAAIGAGAGAVAGYFGSSCSVPPPDDDLVCGTHYKGGAAFLGAVLGAGVGALIGLAFRR
jgi:hypothetical protein